jgi:hypothetical protein
MGERLNELGQPIGFPVADWAGATEANRDEMVGLRCRLETLDADAMPRVCMRPMPRIRMPPIGPISALWALRQ